MLLHVQTDVTTGAHITTNLGPIPARCNRELIPPTLDKQLYNANMAFGVFLYLIIMLGIRDDGAG